MNKVKKILISTIAGISCFSALYSMSFDNRFLPLNPRCDFKDIVKRSHVKAEGFFITADSAYGDVVTPKKGIPELYGKFDQKVLGQALAVVGLPNPLRPAWQLADNIKWNTQSKIQGQGLFLKGEYAVNKIFALGVEGSFLHITSNLNFIIPADIKRDLALTGSDEVELDADRRSMLTSLGLDKNRWSKSSLSDVHFYGRCNWTGEYVLKSRKADFGVQAGLVLPSGALRDINNAASIPVAGDGHYGFIIGSDFSLELKEDWWFNIQFQMNKRLEKTYEQRIPVFGEPLIFGATKGNILISPGLTIVVSPAVRFEDIQNGFGLQLQYLYGFHGGDVWTDVRDNKTVPIQYSQLYDISKWRTEYLNFALFYDTTRSVKEKAVQPIITFSWDIPVKILKPKNVTKAQRIAIGFALNF